MNNYPNFKNFNYENMFNNMQFDNTIMPENNQNTNLLYDPYNGFIRGNLFKNLYDAYESNEPYEVKPMNEQAKLLTKIDSLGFALVDLNLFLDVNPNNTDMINLYNNYLEQKEKLTNEYERKYGPITTDSKSLNSYPWAWNDMPWPWDN